MRSVSWLFAAKCFTEVPMPCPWMPLTRAEASSPATYGSSEKYSKFRPHNGDRLMFRPGPNRTPTPSARLSSPSALPTSVSRAGFHVEARPTAGGKHVAGTESLMPMWSDEPACLRTPWGPSVSITSGSPASGTAWLCQKSAPPVSAMAARISGMRVPFVGCVSDAGSKAKAEAVARFVRPRDGCMLLRSVVALLQAALEVGHVRQQALRVLVLRVEDDVVGDAPLDDQPVLHHDDLVGQVARLTDVVGDEQHGEPEPIAQVLQHVQRAHAQGRIEHGRRLVGEQHLRVHHQRPRDHHALTLSAGQLVRVLVDRVSGLETHVAEAALDELVQGLVALLRRHTAPQHGADGVELVERRERVLEHRLHVPPVRAKLGTPDVGDVLAQVLDRPARPGHEPQHHPRQRRLARPGLPHDSEHLAGVEVHAHIVDGGDVATGDLELLDDVDGGQDGQVAVRHCCRVLRCCGGHTMLTSIGTVTPGFFSAHQQATWWLPSSRNGGSLVLHSGMANAQRGWNRQPLGGSPKFGGDPGMPRTCFVLVSLVGSSTAASRADVYG